MDPICCVKASQHRIMVHAFCVTVIHFLQKLEAEFPEQALLPDSAALRDEADTLMSQAEDLSAAGFRSDFVLHDIYQPGCMGAHMGGGRCPHAWTDVAIF